VRWGRWRKWEGTKLPGAVFAEETNCFKKNRLNLRPLSLSDPAKEFIAVGGREVAWFPRFPLEKIGHSDTGTQLISKDICSLLSRILNPKDI